MQINQNIFRAYDIRGIASKDLSDEFVEGDEILLNYHAGDAVYLYKNGKERGKFPGLAFKQALFGIWLGGKPADDDLKEGMLGL